MHFERKRYFRSDGYAIKKFYSRTEIQKEFSLKIQGLNSEISAGRLEEIVQSPPILIRETTPEMVEQKKSPSLLSLRNYKTYY